MPRKICGIPLVLLALWTGRKSPKHSKEVEGKQTFWQSPSDENARQGKKQDLG